MARKSAGWQHHRELEAKKFMDGWDWEDVYRTWKFRMNDFGVQLEPLFIPIHVHDPHNPSGRESHLTWCPSDKIAEYTLELQRHYDRFPGTYGPVNVHVSRKGEQVTLSHLWDFKDEPTVVAAILISASLFYRVGSNRSTYPRDSWPPYYCVRQLEELALEHWGRSQSPWHYSSTQMLPITSHDWEYKIIDLLGLVCHLAVEHAMVFLRYRPVVINYERERDPLIESKLQQEYEKREQDKIEREQRWQRERQAELEYNEIVKKEHPRYGEWQYIGRDELLELVWTMPTVEVAKLFGVSDSAVGKRCQSLGVEKPPPQVRSGKRVHPRGKPQSHSMK